MVVLYTDVSGQPIGFIFKDQAEDCLSLKNGTDMLSRNVGIELPSYTMWYPRRAHLLICIAAEAWSHSTRNLTQFYALKIKVKCTLVQALRLCTSRAAHRGSRGIALVFHDHGTRRGWGVSVTLRSLFTPGKDSVPIVQEVGWAPGPVWTSAKNLAPTGIRCVQPVASHYTDWATRSTVLRNAWN